MRTLKEKDIPEPWFGNKGKSVNAPKQTRAASKIIAQQEVVEEVTVPKPSTRGRGRQKGKAKEVVPAKGRKNTKTLRSGTANILLGISKTTVPDPEELRRKRIEDAVACGRVVRTVAKQANRHACPTTAARSSSEEDIQAELEAGGTEMDCHSPSANDRKAPQSGNAFQNRA